MARSVVAEVPANDYPCFIPSRLSIRVACGVLLVTLLGAQTAVAHFLLDSPASWRAQDSLGNPQKLGPCGNDGEAQPTGVVTAFAPGQTITISLDETIFHPGHYRVALAVSDRSELPAEPPVTPGGSACGSVPIMDPPQFPVLADGMLPHASPFPDPVSFQVTLPADVTCTRCTLQVLEFMSEHGQPCFYHHCADISIQAGAETHCTTAAQCDDGSVCTVDRCAASGACEHVDTVTPTCDDGDACSVDRCAADTGCVAEPITPSDAGPGALGSLRVDSCSADHVPPVIGKLFQRAESALLRAALPGAKANRLLGRARQRLRTASTKLTRLPPRRVSAGCRRDLGEVLAGAQATVDCLLSAAPR